MGQRKRRVMYSFCLGWVADFWGTAGSLFKVSHPDLLCPDLLYIETKEIFQIATLQIWLSF